MGVRTSIQVIERAANLLDAIAANAQDASLKVLSADTGLHPSTAFRILASLSQRGFVARDSAGRYCLGEKLLQLGAQVPERAALCRAARGVMIELHRDLGEAVNLVLREGDEAVYVERVTVVRAERVIGGRVPLHVIAAGKLILGEAGPEACRRYAERTGLPAYTPKSITALDPLVAAVRSAMERGYALDEEEAEVGVGCIGVLVRDSRSATLAGLSLSYPIERFRSDWIPHVIRAGQRLAERLMRAPATG